MTLEEDIQKAKFLPEDFVPVLVDEAHPLVFSYHDLLVVKPNNNPLDTVFLFNSHLASGFSAIEQGYLVLHLDKYEPYSSFGYMDLVHDLHVLPKDLPPQEVCGEDMFDALFGFNNVFYGVNGLHAVWKANFNRADGFGTNITQFNNNIENGYDLLDAAANTFTGRRANRFGLFPKKVMYEEKTPSGFYKKVEFLFAKDLN